MFITCSSILLYLLGPGKFYCWNPATWRLELGPMSLLTTAPTEPAVGSALLAIAMALPGRGGLVVLHGTAPQLPPASHRPEGTWHSFPSPDSLIRGWQLDFGASGWLLAIHLQACMQGLGAQSSPRWQGSLTLGLRQQSGDGGCVLKVCLMLSHRATHRPFPCAACLPPPAPAILYIFKDIAEF